MRFHRSLPSAAASQRGFLREVGTPVLAGSALVAVVAGFVGLAWANSRSSSACEIDSAASSEATADPGPVAGVDCDTAAVMAGTLLQDSTASETTTSSNEPDHAMGDQDAPGHAMPGDETPGDEMSGQVVVVAAEPVSTDPDSVATTPDDTPVDDSAPVNATPADSGSAPATSTPTDPAPDAATATTPTDPPAQTNPDPAPTTSAPTNTAPATSAPTNPDPAPTTSAPADPVPTNPNPIAASYSDIMTFGVFHGTSSHTHGDSLAGGRTAITTEALVAYNGLRAFHGLGATQPEAIGRWAFANRLTNNSEAYGEELTGVGLYYGMQGAKVGWIRDDAFNPQILADIQRTAREGGTGAVMTMVEAYGHPGYADHLTQSGLVDAFVNTLKMEPHYGGWMHGRVHGGLPFSDGTGASVATAHDLNHLTVLSHDQGQPFMNDTFDWPQWPALDVPESDVIDYFQSMVVLGDPHGDALP